MSEWREEMLSLHGTPTKRSPRKASSSPRLKLGTLAEEKLVPSSPSSLSPTKLRAVTQAARFDVLVDGNQGTRIELLAALQSAEPDLQEFECVSILKQLDSANDVKADDAENHRVAAESKIIAAKFAVQKEASRATGLDVLQYVDFYPLCKNPVLRTDNFEDLDRPLSRAVEWLDRESHRVKVLGITTLPVDTTDARARESTFKGRYKAGYFQPKERQYYRYGVWNVARVFYRDASGQVQYEDFIPEDQLDTMEGEDEYESVASTLGRAHQWILKQPSLALLGVDVFPVWTTFEALNPSAGKDAGKYETVDGDSFVNVCRRMVYKAGTVTFEDFCASAGEDFRAVAQQAMDNSKIDPESLATLCCVPMSRPGQQAKLGRVKTGPQELRNVDHVVRIIFEPPALPPVRYQDFPPQVDGVWWESVDAMLHRAANWLKDTDATVLGIQTLNVDATSVSTAKYHPQEFKDLSHYTLQVWDEKQSQLRRFSVWNVVRIYYRDDEGDTCYHDFVPIRSPNGIDFESPSITLTKAYLWAMQEQHNGWKIISLVFVPIWTDQLQPPDTRLGAGAYKIIGGHHTLRHAMRTMRYDPAGPIIDMAETEPLLLRAYGDGDYEDVGNLLDRVGARLPEAPAGGGVFLSTVPIEDSKSHKRRQGRFITGNPELSVRTVFQVVRVIYSSWGNTSSEQK